MSETSFPPRERDPQTLDRAGLITETVRRLQGADDLALRDALELLMCDEDWDTYRQRAPMQCFHCGAVFHSRTAQRIHFGETPSSIPLCLAPEAASALLRIARKTQALLPKDLEPPLETSEWREQLTLLCIRIEKACAESAPDAPRSRRLDEETRR